MRTFLILMLAVMFSAGVAFADESDGASCPAEGYQGANQDFVVDGEGDKEFIGINDTL